MEILFIANYFIPPQTLLLRLCFDEGSLDTADRAIKSLFQCGSPLTSEAFVEWAGHCGPITPQQANRVSHTIPRGYTVGSVIIILITQIQRFSDFLKHSF